MKPPPAFQLYAQDFLVGCADLTAEQTGAYIRLLCYQWVKGGLPDDTQLLASMAGCHGNATAVPLHKFGIGSDGLRRNERLEKVRAENEEYRKKQAINAEKRWNSRVGNANPMPSHNQPNAKLMPVDMPNACPSSSSSSSNKIEPKVSTQSKKEASGSHQEFTSKWMEAYKEVHGGAEYLHSGGKDGKAVSSLLQSKLSPDELIAIARKAWGMPEKFNCKLAVSISGFSARFNDIRAEVGDLKAITSTRKEIY